MSANFVKNVSGDAFIAIITKKKSTGNISAW